MRNSSVRKYEKFPLIIDRQTKSLGKRNIKGIFESKETSPIAISKAWIALDCTNVPSSQLTKAHFSFLVAQLLFNRPV